MTSLSPVGLRQVLSRQSSPWFIGASLLILVAFGIVTADIQRDSLWNDEGWTVWAVYSPYLADMFARVRGDVHPPFYFLVLYGWVRLTGESVYTLRLLSALFGMIGLAATYAVGKKLIDRPTGLMALVILGTASFFVYYTREARMYTLLLALGALSTWAYLLWRERSTLFRALAYGLLMAAMLYTHYAGGIVIMTHILHLLLTYPYRGVQDSSRIFASPPPGAKATRLPEKTSPLKGLTRRLPVLSGHTVVTRRKIHPSVAKFRISHILTPYLLTLLLYSPWLPIFLNQMRANPDGPLAIPVQTDWAALAALVLILVGGSWWLYVMPLVLGRAIPNLRQYGSGVLLLVLWLLLTPMVLLALNAWIAPVYQVRYAIAMLPAGALLVAYGLRWIGFPGLLKKLRLAVGTRYISSLQILLAAILLFLIVYAQLTIYPELWPEKPPWEGTIRAMTSARDPLEPTITDIAAYSPVAYYDRLLNIRQGVSLDLSWRPHNYDEIMNLVAKFDRTPSVWVALPVNTAKTWHIVAALDGERQASYRSSLVNMIFYRFDQGGGGDLEFRFGDLLRYVSGPGASQRFSVAAGGSLCVDLALQTLAVLDGAYSVGLHLVDITGTTLVAQWDAGLGTPAAGESLALKPCIDIPANASPGYYHLELVVYEWANQKRLRLFEDGGGEPLPWGDVLMLAAVDVTG